MLVEDRSEHLGPRVETAVEKAVDEVGEKSFGVLHCRPSPFAGLDRLGTLPGIFLGVRIRSPRSLEIFLGRLEVVDDVLYVLLGAVDLRVKRLPAERLRILAAHEVDHYLGSIGPAGATEIGREIVFGLDSEAHNGRVVEAAGDEVDHVRTAPRDVAGLLRLELPVLLPRASAYADLKRGARKAEVVLYGVLERKAAVHRELEVHLLRRHELRLGRHVLDNRYGGRLHLVREAVGIPHLRAPAAFAALLEVERERESAVRLGSRNHNVAGERNRALDVGTRRLDGNRDLRPLEADYRGRVRVALWFAAGVLGVTHLDHPLGIPRLGDNLYPVRARQGASAAYPVVEALRHARIGERIYHGAFSALFRNPDHPLHGLAPAVLTRPDERPRRKAFADGERESEGSALEYDLVAGRHLERRGVDVVNLGGRNECARRKPERGVWKRREQEEEYAYGDRGGDKPRLHGPSRELLLGRNRLHVLDGVLRNLLHETGGRRQVASLRELDDGGKTLLEFGVVAFDERRDLGSRELAAERLYQSKPRNRGGRRDAAGPEEPSDPRDIDRHHRVDRHCGEDRCDEDGERGACAAHEENAANPTHALVELGGYLWRYVLVFHGIMQAKRASGVSIPR